MHEHRGARTNGAELAHARTLNTRLKFISEGKIALLFLERGETQNSV